MKTFSLYIVLSLLIISGCKSSEDETIKRTAFVMGSTIEVQLRGVNEEKANKIINSVFAEARRIDTLFSTYIKNNNMWKINNNTSEKIVVDEETFTVLKKCNEVWKASGGAFDPAVGKIIDLVGFEKGAPHIPSSAEILEALKNVGWKKIQIIEPNILIKPNNVRLSFNAVVPGYTADKCSKIIEAAGCNNYLINVGGEIFLKGDNWNIGIQHPREKDNLLYKIICDTKGISTSGDYEQYFKQDKKRITHIFNPVTGNPANECEAVTIISNDAFSADALSTAVFVLGPKNGLKLIESLKDVEGIIVDTTGTIIKSSGFEKFIAR